MPIFNPNIPRPTDFLSNSQGDLLSNNQQLNATFSLNHIPLNVATNNGKHTFVEMVNSAGLPAGLATGEGTTYTRSIGSISQLFYSPDNTGNQYQMTVTDNSVFSSFGGSGTVGNSGSSGWTFLPGGLIMNYGKVGSVSGTSTVITFAKNFPNSFLNAIITPSRNNTNDKVVAIQSGSPGVSGFTITYSSADRPTSIYWIAIGN